VGHGSIGLLQARFFFINFFKIFFLRCQSKSVIMHNKSRFDVLKIQGMSRTHYSGGIKGY